jgi:outer membrane protein TolC
MLQKSFRLKILFFIGYFLMSKTSFSQTVDDFTFAQFWQSIEKFHPIAQKSALLVDGSAAQKMVARGGFDPVLNADYAQKTFKKNNYYQVSENYLSLPNWYGITGKVGYSTSSGINLNPEEALPAAGQPFLGVSWTILQGFGIDERRATLQKAKNLVNLNENNRRKMLNDLRLDAAKTYFEWAFDLENLTIQRDFLANVAQRQVAILALAQLGDRPFIDTLEASLQTRERRAEVQNAENERAIAASQLELFLWKSDGEPQILPFEARPEKLENSIFSFEIPENQSWTMDFVRNHPDFLVYLFKENELKIEQRFKREKRKPKLDLNYNLLGNGTDLTSIDPANAFKWGLKFSFPILNRSARGEIDLARLKLIENRLSQNQKQAELTQKTTQLLLQKKNVEQLLILQNQMIVDWKLLLEAEKTRFSMGESSLFLLYARELKVLEMQQKILKLRAELAKISASLAWMRGF